MKRELLRLSYEEEEMLRYCYDVRLQLLLILP